MTLWRKSWLTFCCRDDPRSSMSVAGFPWLFCLSRGPCCLQPFVSSEMKHKNAFHTFHFFKSLSWHIKQVCFRWAIWQGAQPAQCKIFWVKCFSFVRSLAWKCVLSGLLGLLFLFLPHHLLLGQRDHVVLLLLGLERPGAGLQVAHEHRLPVQVDLEHLHLPLLPPHKALRAMLWPVRLTLHITGQLSLQWYWRLNGSVGENRQYCQCF